MNGSEAQYAGEKLTLLKSMFLVDVRKGQKTGFYLDQRQNRAQLPAYCAGVEALNAFSYTGAFAVYALAGGASSVVNVDTSDEALLLARRNVGVNGFLGPAPHLRLGTCLPSCVLCAASTIRPRCNCASQTTCRCNRSFP